jgi:hypothetical protein
MENSLEYCIKVCNSLLRGELSAVETYSQAIEKFGFSAAENDLRRIRSEHAHSANRLSASVRDMGGEPDHDSGAWGLFATAVQGAANLFGPDSAIESLRRGEETGRGDYQDALLEDEMTVDCKLMIREKLLPRIIHHIATLENLEMELQSASR